MAYVTSSEFSIILQTKNAQITKQENFISKP